MLKNQLRGNVLSNFEMGLFDLSSRMVIFLVIKFNNCTLLVDEIVHFVKTAPMLFGVA
jgi:hypothetical protein